jgi:FAD/FMN-containing dehydrogenase
MSKLNAELRTELQQIFGNHISFRKLERKLYGHDIAAVPGLIKPLIGKTVPEVVVQPETKEELVKLVRWAVRNDVPLTPHGKASSGYGGAIPVNGGVVLDFYRMRAIKHVDPDNKTVTVEASMVWEKLDLVTWSHWHPCAQSGLINLLHLQQISGASHTNGDTPSNHYYITRSG